MTSFWKATNACWKVSVFVKMAVVTARKAHAPVGSGSNTSPATGVPLHIKLGSCVVLHIGVKAVEGNTKASQVKRPRI